MGRAPVDNRKTIGILGGSFNPVHSGHLMLASYLRQSAGLDAVWLMLSPCNPLKQRINMASDSDRMEMLRLACRDSAPEIAPCDIELSLPRPSYTVDTLAVLAERFPDYRFRLVVGSDNWLIFDRWRESQKIIDDYGVIVYPRPGYPVDRSTLPPNVEVVDAPWIEISSTFVREAISWGWDLRWFLPDSVIDYIHTHRCYR